MGMLTPTHSLTHYCRPSYHSFSATQPTVSKCQSTEGIYLYY